MTDRKISELVAVTTVEDTDEYVVARAGASNKITGASLKSEIGGSVPFPMTAGSGSPVGAVAPEARGHVYQDTDTGATFVAWGLTNTDWMQFGGQQEQLGAWPDTTLVAGIATILHELNGAIRGLSIISPSAYHCGVTITDVNAALNSGNGLYWTTNFDVSPDGAQECHIYTGPAGDFLTVLADASGNMKPGNTIDVSGIPTSNPGPGLLWNDAGVLKVGT